MRKNFWKKVGASTCACAQSLAKFAHMPNTDLIGSAESASLIGISRATFNRWVTAGRIVPAVELDGQTGARLFHRSDVEAVRECRETKASA